MAATKHQALEHPWIERLYAEGEASAVSMQVRLDEKLAAKKDMPEPEVRVSPCAEGRGREGGRRENREGGEEGVLGVSAFFESACL